MTPRSVPELLSAAWSQPLARLLVYLMLALVAWWFARLLSSIIITGLIAYALAFVVHPIVVWLEKRGLKRFLAVGLIVMVVTVMTAFLGWVVLSQVVSLIANLPALLTRLPEIINGGLDRLGNVPGMENVQQQVNTYLTEQTQSLSRNLGPTLQGLLNSGGALLGGVVNVVGWIGQIGFALILSLYFLMDYERVGASVLKVLPRAWQPLALQLSEDVGVSFGGYIRGQLLVGLGVGALIAVGLLLLGIPNALAIGLLAALLDIVPYLGPVISALPAVLLALSSGWVTVLLVVLVFVAANQIEGNVLSPFIMRQTTNLSSAAVLLAILAGLTLGGVVGALLAIPVTTLLKRWLKRYWLESAAHNAPPR